MKPNWIWLCTGLSSAGCIDEPRPREDTEQAAQVVALGCLPAVDHAAPNHFRWDADRQRLTMTLFKTPFAACSEPRATVTSVEGDLAAIVIEPAKNCSTLDVCDDGFGASIQVIYDGSDLVHTTAQITTGAQGAPDFQNVLSGSVPLGEHGYLAQMVEVQSVRWDSEGVLHAQAVLPGAVECFTVLASRGYTPDEPEVYWFAQSVEDAPIDCPGQPAVVDVTADLSFATASMVRVVSFAGGVHQVSQVPRTPAP